MAGPAPYPGTGGATPTPTPTPGAGTGGPAPYPTPAPTVSPTPTPTPTPIPGALPDLVVSDKWETFANGEVIVHFIVKNIGNAEAGTSTACKEVNGVVVDTDDDVPKLGPDKSYTGAFTAEDCTPGKTITVTVCADNYGVVAESNETNNCKTNTFTCPEDGVPQPGGRDLVIQITKVMKQKVTTTQCKYKVKWTATNIGNSVAAENAVALLIGGVEKVVLLPEAGGCDALGPLASDTGVFDWRNCPVACGAIDDVEVRVDYYNTVGESNENNNNDSKDVKCQLGVGVIEVNKTVRDNQGDLVYEIDANSSDEVEFNCTVHNNGSCCNLTNITVTDVLSSSLEYINATGPGTLEATVGGVTTLKWEVTDPLEPCKWLNYTIFARVKKTGCGVDTNTQTATAKTCTGDTVSDSNTSKVNVATRAGIHVNKTQGVGFNFTLTVTNNGSCCDLTDVNVWDTMVNLTYNKTIEGGNPVSVLPCGLNATVVNWYIGSLPTGESRRFIVNTTWMIDPWTNDLQASGKAACTGAWISHNETKP
jgi:uncharacterized repeat protein (TIGR01451 family)